MALQFPILMTNLKAYDALIVEDLGFEYLNAMDLDSLQCLISIIYFFGQLVDMFRISSPIGKKNFKSLNINMLMEDPRSVELLKQFNKLFLI